MTTSLDITQVKANADILRTVGQYTQLKPSGSKEHVGLCPFHDDKNPSLFVNQERGSFHCFGCDAKGDVIRFVQQVENVEFAEALKRVAEDCGMAVPSRSRSRQRVDDTPKTVNSSLPIERNASQSKPEPKLIKTYDYVDEEGELLHQVLRYNPKGFKQRRPDPESHDGWTWKLAGVRRVLYRLPAVRAAETVYVLEGEKDADALFDIGLVGTTNAGGAQQAWQSEWTQVLAGKKIIVLPDNDELGLRRGAAITRELQSRSIDVLLVRVPSPYKDISDFLRDGHERADLEELVSEERKMRRREYLGRKALLTLREVIDTVDGGLTAFLRPPPGLATGFGGLDRMTLGLHAGELIILAARPAMGKSALALNIAENVARSGETVAFLSYEMSAQSLFTRLLCSQARVDSQRLRQRILNQEERRRINRALTESVELPLLIDDTKPDLKVIEKRLANLREKMGLGLVIVDYLQLLGGGSENRNREIGNFTRKFKLLAGQLRCPFLVLSQLNRAIETRTGKNRPQLSDLRDSGEIENHADVVMFIYRRELYEPDKPELRGKAELIFAKQRTGPVGKVHLRFEPKWTRFRESFSEGQDSVVQEMA